MEYVIGVDAGGTSTEAIAYSIRGEELARARTSGANPAAQGSEIAVDRIIKAIDECVRMIDQECSYALIGAAGVESGGCKGDVVLALRSQYIFPLNLVSDAQLLLDARLGEADGIVVVSGTGSVAWGRKGGRIERCGGWGHLLGDEGSGYDVVMRTLKNLFRERDQGREPSAIGRAIVREIGGNCLADIVDFVYSHNKAEVSALFAPIASAAATGDPDAVATLEMAGEHLAGLAASCASKLGLDAPLVGVGGRVLLHDAIVRDSFKTALTNELQGIRFDTNQRDVQRAALDAYARIGREAK